MTTLLEKAKLYKEKLNDSMNENLFVSHNSVMDKIKENLDLPIREIMKSQTDFERITQGM